MELYKWYNNTELPQEECDCILIWKQKWSGDIKEYWITNKALGYVNKEEPEDGGGLTFCDSLEGDTIPIEHIIRWMPIEYPDLPKI